MILIKKSNNRFNNIDLQYDLSSLDINKGDYQIKVFRKDSSGNQEKRNNCTCKRKPKQELSAAKIYHGGGVICMMQDIKHEEIVH
ncbi:MAG: hypothetical protein ACLR43_13380 [Faecalibacillus faecis]